MLRLTVLANPAAVGRAAAEHVAEVISRRPAAVIALPTGGTPGPMYAELASLVRAGRLDASKVRWVQLDEWSGLPAGHSATCAAWLEEHFFGPAGLRPALSISSSADPQHEAAKVRAWLAEQPLDLAILGIGVNGHLGLNEPAALLARHAHVAELAEPSRQHPMLGELRGVPTHGVTLGLADILTARSGVLTLATGAAKAAAVARVVSGPLTTSFPASLLCLARESTLLVDSPAASLSAPTSQEAR